MRSSDCLEGLERRHIRQHDGGNLVFWDTGFNIVNLCLFREASENSGNRLVHVTVSPRPGRVRDDDAGSGGYFVSPALVVAPSPDAGIVRLEQFAPALPVILYDDITEAIEAANDTPFGLCASVWSNDDALAAGVASRLSAGTVFVNAHGLSAIDMYAPMGGWKQSGFGVELGTEGMQAFARQRVRVRRPGPAEQEGQT